MEAPPGYGVGKKATVSISKRANPIYSLSQVPTKLSSATHEIGPSFIRAAAHILGFPRPEAFSWSKLA